MCGVVNACIVALGYSQGLPFGGVIPASDIHTSGRSINVACIVCRCHRREGKYRQDPQ